MRYHEGLWYAVCLTLVRDDMIGGKDDREVRVRKKWTRMTALDTGETAHMMMREPHVLVSLVQHVVQLIFLCYLAESSSPLLFIMSLQPACIYKRMLREPNASVGAPVVGRPRPGGAPLAPAAAAAAAGPATPVTAMGRVVPLAGENSMAAGRLPVPQAGPVGAAAEAEPAAERMGDPKPRPGGGARLPAGAAAPRPGGGRRAAEPSLPKLLEGAANEPLEDTAVAAVGAASMTTVVDAEVNALMLVAAVPMEANLEEKSLPSKAANKLLSTLVAATERAGAGAGAATLATKAGAGAATGAAAGCAMALCWTVVTVTAATGATGTAVLARPAGAAAAAEPGWGIGGKTVVDKMTGALELTIAAAEEGAAAAAGAEVSLSLPTLAASLATATALLLPAAPVLFLRAARFLALRA